MLAEREVLVTFLKLTRDGSAKIDEISQEAKVPAEIVYEVLSSHFGSNIMIRDNDIISANAEQRLKTAIKAIELGTDIERACKFLTWKEFEDISIMAFEANDFIVKKHFRFKSSERRWEIDILALKEPIVASVDCKQWHHGWRGAGSKKAVESQIERTRALSKAAGLIYLKIGTKDWRHTSFIPIILSLMPGSTKFHHNVPIVPVLQLRDFLQELPAFARNIVHFNYFGKSPSQKSVTEFMDTRLAHR